MIKRCSVCNREGETSGGGWVSSFSDILCPDHSVTIQSPVFGYDGQYISHGDDIQFLYDAQIFTVSGITTSGRLQFYGSQLSFPASLCRAIN